MKMSVLNQSGEEQVECPLCMESLEVDDLNFYPCTCLYQICRFCWHRIRTDENGLCPACRKAYPEDPADFKPLSQEEVARMKAEKRAKDQQRKQKITENRKHLANVRVVQKNLVFVVGLPMRLTDPEILKKHEYFGKYGKIHKVVINQSTTYAGSQGPSASAYVTYQRSEDALRAIQSINHVVVDNRIIKTSLGTTKYCSHFMKNQPCPKQDCMYLHDLGDPEASFTKEAMQQGKHQEFEKKLHEQLLKDTAANNNNNNITNNNTSSNNRKNTALSPSPPVGTIIITPDDSNSESTTAKHSAKLSESSEDSASVLGLTDSVNGLTDSTTGSTSSMNKEAWPSLSQEMLAASPTPSSESSETSGCHIGNGKTLGNELESKRTPSSHSNSTSSEDMNIISMAAQLLEDDDDDDDDDNIEPPKLNHEFGEPLEKKNHHDNTSPPTTNVHHPLLGSSYTAPPPSQTSHPATSNSQQAPPSKFNESFFSSNGLGRLSPPGHTLSSPPPPPPPQLPSSLSSTHNVDVISNSLSSDWFTSGLSRLPDILPPVHSSEDWEVAFGFRNSTNTPTSLLNGTSTLHQQLQQAHHSLQQQTLQQQRLEQQQQQARLEQQQQQHRLEQQILQQTLQQQQQQQQHSLNNHLLLGTHSNHINNSQPLQQHMNGHLSQHQHQPQTHQMSSNHISRHDDDLGFDPFHETQKALAEMIEKEEQRTRLNHYHQQQQAQNLLQQNLLREQQQQQQQQHSLLQASLLAQAREQQLREQQQQNLIAAQVREFQQQRLERERLAALFDPRGPAPSLANSSLNHKGVNSSDQYTSALNNCSKLLDNLCLSQNQTPSNQQQQANSIRSRFAPPPGFLTPSTQNGAGVFNPKLLDLDLSMGSKLLPWTASSPAHSNPVNNFQHSLGSNNPASAPAWDWTALDPAIMSAGQHCDVFTTPPPPGFSLRQTLDNF